MVYQFKEGSRLGGNAQEVGEALEQVRIRNGLTAATVVAAARAEDSYLHRYFTWDDSEAAEKCRLHEARTVMACVCVVGLSPQQKAPIRAFVAVGSKQDRYIPVETALSQESLRKRMLAQALGDLEAFKERYSHVEELARVFTAIEEVLPAKAATAFG